MSTSTHPLLTHAPMSEIVSGLTRHGLDDDTIGVYTFTSTARSTLDGWYDWIRSLSQTWDATRPFLILYDVSHVYLNPYFRQRANDIQHLNRAEIYGATAILLPDSLWGNIIKAFVKRDLAKANYRSEMEVFTKMEAGVQWLRHMRITLTTYESPSHSTNNPANI